MAGALLLVHLLGFSLSLGAAAVKTSLLLACRADPGLVPAFVGVSRRITVLIVAGMALVTLSGAALAVEHAFTRWLAAKIALVVAVWLLGPLIDKTVEPAFIRLAPAVGARPTEEFARVQRRYLSLELVATGLLGAIAVLGVIV